MPAAIKRLTYADTLKFPDDGNRHEIIDGEWIMTPPPSMGHQAIVTQLSHLLLSHATQRKLGRVLVAPLAVVLGRHTVPQPDIVFVSESRRSILKKDGIHGAPDLVVEVLSPSTEDYDRGKKGAAYEKAGVKEYWLIDPEERTVEIRAFGSPRRTSVYPADQKLESVVLPGLDLEVSEIFALLD